MRLKNVKGANDIIVKGIYYIDNPSIYKGKWNKLFNNNNPIYIELGMGKGDFIINNAIKYPNINFIGIEKYDSVIVRAISTIYLNFSDPWPKERHAKRRLTSNIFLDKYSKIFKNNYIIEMKTDNIDLFNYSVESLKNYGYVIEYITNDLHSENIDNIETEYEHKFSSKGIKINKFIAKKVK